MSHLPLLNIPSPILDYDDLLTLPQINLLEQDFDPIEFSVYTDPDPTLKTKEQKTANQIIQTLPNITLLDHTVTSTTRQQTAYAIQQYKESLDLLKMPQSEDQILRGIECLKNSASYEYPQALFVLSYYYYYGKFNLQKNEQEALRLLKKAAQYGLEEAQKALADFQAQKVQAEQNLIKLANENDSEAQYKVGYLFLKGEHFEKDYEQAYNLLLKAAKQKHPKAVFCLGLIYHKGYGREKNIRKAARLYVQSAQLGYRKAQYNTALCCKKGIGCRKNEEKAFEYFLKSAAQNYVPAQFSLALCYETGLGCNIDLVSAFFYYEIAASAGHKGAQYNLGRCHSNGYGTKIDYPKALEYFKKAATQNHKQAQESLVELQTYLDKVKTSQNEIAPGNTSLPKPTSTSPKNEHKRKKARNTSYPKRVRNPKTGPP